MKISFVLFLFWSTALHCSGQSNGKSLPLDILLNADGITIILTVTYLKITNEGVFIDGTFSIVYPKTDKTIRFQGKNIPVNYEGKFTTPFLLKSLQPILPEEELFLFKILAPEGNSYQWRYIFNYPVINL